MTGRPGCRTMEKIGGSSVSYLARKRPLTSPYLYFFEKGGHRRAFRLPGQGVDHFHCTVWEPSPVHIRCRMWGSSLKAQNLSAPSPGDDLRSRSAIRLRGQIVRSDSFWGIGCDFSVVTIRLRLQCILRWKKGQICFSLRKFLAISPAIQKNR